VPKQSLERSGEKLAESAEKIKHGTYGVGDSVERTTQLAADRTVFAAERTYASWVRTGSACEGWEGQQYVMQSQSADMGWV